MRPSCDLPASWVGVRVTLVMEWTVGVPPTQVRIVLDPPDAVAEQDEDNNTWVEPV